MSVRGFNEFQQLNVRDAERPTAMDLDLNHPPPGENMARTGPLRVQVQQNGHSQGQATTAADIVDDEVVVISPRKFEEARNRRNQSRRSHGVIGLSEGAVCYTNFSELTNWSPFSHVGALSWELSFNFDVRNNAEDTATSNPEPTVVPQSEPPVEVPTFTCAICMGQLIEETSTRCGHIFCKNCIETAIATQHKCPTCRRKLRKRDTIRVYLPNAN